MAEDIYYPNFMLEGRLVDIVEPDLQTCETLGLLLRLEGMRASFALNLEAFFAIFERRRAPTSSSPTSICRPMATGSCCCGV